jgi:hypothetical protein
VQEGTQTETGITWRTIFVGRCEAHEDDDIAGGDSRSGTRVYHIAESLSIMRQWVADRHAMQNAEMVGPDSYTVDMQRGDISYNITSAGKKQFNRGSVQLNRGAFVGPVRVGDDRFYCHRLGGIGAPWTDFDVLQHLTNCHRPGGEPVFVPWTDTTPAETRYDLALSNSIQYWQFSPEQTVLDRVAAVCDFRRGMVLCHPQYIDGPSDESGSAVACRLARRSPFDASFIINDINGNSIINVEAGTVVNLRLQGDHRVDGNITIAQVETERCDAVEAIGERIQVAGNFARWDRTKGQIQGSTTAFWNGWTTIWDTRFRALSFDARAQENTRHVMQRFDLSESWAGKCPNSKVLTSDFESVSHIYFCNHNGKLQVDNVNYPSLLGIDILPDTPFYEGYKYDGTTAKKTDGTGDTGETLEPVRRRAQILIYLDQDKYLDGEIDEQCTFSIDGRSIWLSHRTDQEDGFRLFSDDTTTAPGVGGIPTTYVGATYPLRALGFVMALAMPDRVRVLRGDPESPARKRMYIPGAELWVATSRMVYEVDRETISGEGYAPKKIDLSDQQETPIGAIRNVALLRDDRNKLCVLAETAFRWYRADDSANPRLALTVTIRDTPGAAQTTAEDFREGAIAFPQIGEIVGNLTHGGRVTRVGAPVTSFKYDHTAGSFTLATSWAELDFS